MNIGDQVTVDAAVTGDGVAHKGWVNDIYEFAREIFVEVKFDIPAADGRLGVVVSNLGLLQ